MIDTNIQFDPKPAFKQLNGIEVATPRIRKKLLGRVFAEAKKSVRKATYGILKKDTGHLQKSLKYKILDADYGVIYNKAFYAGTHLTGKIIRPKKGKYLRFIVDGEYRTAPYVVIPKRDFFFPKAEQFFSSSRPVEIMQAALDKELEKLKG